MKSKIKLFPVILVSTLSITLSSCGEKKKEDSVESEAKAKQAEKTHDSVSKDFVTRLQEMSDTLATINDLESAKSALPDLTKIGFKLKMIKTDMEKLGPNVQGLEAKYVPQMKAAMDEIAQNMKSLKTSNPEAYRMIEKVMNTIM